MKMKQIVSVTLFFMLFASLALSQTSDAKSQTVSPNLLEKIDLKFNLTGTPKPEDVGFDDRNSSWKLTYHLLLSNEKTVTDLISKAYANCGENVANNQKCVARANKKLDKQFRKTALSISRGSFKRNSLLLETNRQILFPIKFMPDVNTYFQ